MTPAQRSNIARFKAASLAFLTNQDVNAAIQTATTAVEFNSILHPSPFPEVEQKKQEALINAGEHFHEGNPLLQMANEGLHNTVEWVNRLNAETPLLRELPIYAEVNQVMGRVRHAVVDLIVPTTNRDISLMVTTGAIGKSIQFGRQAAAIGETWTSGMNMFRAMNIEGLNVVRASQVGRTMEAPVSSMIRPYVPLLEGPHHGLQQINLNYQAGRSFQTAVHESLRLPENKHLYDVLLPGRGMTSTIPDLSLSTAGVTDIKNVQYITFTKQLRAQAALAKERGTSFNLIISPSTQKVSIPLRKAIRETNGKIFEFNPATAKWIERIVDGNKVLR